MAMARAEILVGSLPGSSGGLDDSGLRAPWMSVLEIYRIHDSKLSRGFRTSLSVVRNGLVVSIQTATFACVTHLTTHVVPPTGSLQPQFIVVSNG